MTRRFSATRVPAMFRVSRRTPCTCRVYTSACLSRISHLPLQLRYCENTNTRKSTAKRTANHRKHSAKTFTQQCKIRTCPPNARTRNAKTVRQRKRTSTPEQHECRATPRGFKDLRLHVKNYRLIYISLALKVVKTL